jgi:hypothetical protein
MIYRTKYGQYIDEEDVLVNEGQLRIYLEGGGAVLPTNFIFPEDEAIDNRITFTKTIGDYFGTVTEPKTGTLTFDMTGAVIGGIAVVYYNNSTLDIPSVFLQMGDFAPSILNKIYLERDGEGNITANIINGLAGSTIPLAPISLVLTEGIFTETPFAPTSLTLTEGTI